MDDELPLSAGERGRLRVSGKINNGGPKLIVQTTNGGIRVTRARAAELHELRGPGS